MRYSPWSIALASGILTFACAADVGRAAAQAPAPDEAVPPPPPENEPACVPSCRNGYTCKQGTCVSLCNPPCASGEECTAAGECIAAAPRYVPPPRYYGPENVPVVPASAETHDGFLLRLTVGAGYGNVSVSASGSDVGIHGGAGTFSIDLGGAVSRDLTIHGRIAYLMLFEPDVTLDGKKVGTANNTTVVAYLIGPAITYYFMPVNVYLTGAVGLSWLRIDNSDLGESARTDLGFGLNADVGKEWWIDDDWGMGVAGRFWFTHTSTSQSGLSENENTTGFAVLFSATYQ